MSIPRVLEVKLREGVKNCGTYDPVEVLSCIEEHLTAQEYDQAEDFLNWVYKNNQTFGHNIAQVWNDYERTTKPKDPGLEGVRNPNDLPTLFDFYKDVTSVYIESKDESYSPIKAIADILGEQGYIVTRIKDKNETPDD